MTQQAETLPMTYCGTALAHVGRATSTRRPRDTHPAAVDF